MKRDNKFAFEIHHHEDTEQDMNQLSASKVTVSAMIATIRCFSYFPKKSKWLAIQNFFKGKLAACWEHVQNSTSYSGDNDYYYDHFLFFPIYHNDGKEFLKLSSVRKARIDINVLENLKEVGGYVLLEDMMKCFPVREVVVNEDCGDASKKY